MRWPRTEALAALAAGALLSLASPASATVRALLIGVGDYPNLPERLHLAAPPRDVERLASALEAAGLERSAITAMTERRGERPTRAAVLARLAALAAEARPGDRVLIYFSGHGAQAPARRPAREPDGLEELYLAADASNWDGREGRVPGSIADFELEDAIAAIRAKGSEVWFVADACHAAGLTRSIVGGKAKSVAASDLGIPMPRGRARAEDRAPLIEGGFTGFYAAAPGALAVERLLPAGSPEAQPSSAFTYALVRALNAGRTRSFRDLALAATAAGVEAGPGAPAPVFEGALNDDVLGLKPERRGFPGRRSGGALVIDAGVLEGFSPGATVEVRAGGQTMGGRVESAGAAGSRIALSGPAPDGPLTVSLASPLVNGVTRGARLLSALAPYAQDAERLGLRVEARLWRNGCGPNPAAQDGFPPDAQPFDLLAPARLAHCDVLYLRFVNQGQSPIDVSPLYVDAAGSVIGLTLSSGDQARLAPGAERFAAVRVLTKDARGRPLPSGVERLAILAAAATAREVLDLRGLAGPALTRGAGPSPAPDLTAQIYALRIG